MKRWVLGVVRLAVLVAAGIGFLEWREGTRNGGQLPAEPLRIAEQQGAR